MRPEDQLLFACTRQVMLEEHRQAILELNRQYNLSWDIVFSKAEQHGVAPLVYINLCQRSSLNLDIPRPIAEHYHMVMLRNTIMKEQRVRKLEEVLAFFSERSIEVMLFKGGVLDLLVYDNPAYVTPRDIDVILRCRQDEISGAERQAFMDYLHRTGIEYDFYEHHDMNINGALPIDFSRIWQDAKKIDFRGQPVYIMCLEDMLISLCINSCRKRFFRLKSLLDIAETLRVVKDLQWELMAEKAIAYDCQNIIYTALLATSLTLGCDIPDKGMESLKVGKISAAMIGSAVSLLIRYTSLPATPDLVSSTKRRPFDFFLLLPYLAYRGYQVRYKLFNEILPHR